MARGVQKLSAGLSKWVSLNPPKPEQGALHQRQNKALFAQLGWQLK